VSESKESLILADVDDRSPRRKQLAIPSLTGLRGAAAVWVAMHHMQGVLISFLGARFLVNNNFFGQGFRAVDLFFVLSGFILMRVHGEQFRKFSPVALREFAIARFFRIYPLNTAILLAMLLLVVLQPGYRAYMTIVPTADKWYWANNLSWPGFVQSLFLVQSFTVRKLGEWNGPSWSLSAELLGYILFPGLAFVAIRVQTARSCFVVALVSVLILAAALKAGHHGTDNPTGNFASVRMFFCFVAGLAVCRARMIIERPSSRTGGVLAELSGLLIIILSLLSLRTAVLSPIGFALLIFGLSYQSGPIDWVLRRRLFLWLGKISFSFYMVQETMLHIFQWRCTQWVMGLVYGQRVLIIAGLVLSFFLVGWGLHHLVEKPSHRLGRRLAKA